MRTEVLGAAAALDQEERWTVEKVMKMHGEGVTVSKVLDEPQRRMMLRKEIDKKLNDGKGECWCLALLPWVMLHRCWLDGSSLPDVTLLTRRPAAAKMGCLVVVQDRQSTS